MTAYLPWNEDEVCILKSRYLSGVPIKIIAKELHRSPTSINKALSRFGIRSSKVKKPMPVPLKIYQETTKPQHSSFSNHNKFLKKSFQEEWVNIEQVINYLKKIGFNIKKVLHNDSSEFYCNDKRLSPLQTLLMANRHRSEHNLSCFKVGDITW